jgi:hypothetical protein
MNFRHSRRAVVGIGLLLLMVSGGLVPLGTAQAAPSAQDTLSFDDPAGLSGQLDAATPQTAYAFECIATGIGSLVVETTAGDLAVDAVLQDAQGSPFAYGLAVPDRAGLTISEGFTMPADGPCTVLLSRQGNTAGTFSVHLLPGYANLTKWDTFSAGADSLHMEWEPYASANMTVTQLGGRLRIEVLKDSLVAYALPTGDDLIWSDFYIQADFSIEGSPGYFEYGLVLRSDDPGDHFYLVSFSSDGDYAVDFFNGEWQSIQGWTVNPVIDGGDTQPRVGVLLQGNVFRLYFNGRFVAEVTDSMNYASAGLSGVAAATIADQFETLTVFVDNVVVTRPYGAGVSALFSGGQGAAQPTPTKPGLLGALGAIRTPVPPTPTLPLAVPTDTPAPPSPYPAQLARWSSSTPAEIVEELQNLDMVPLGGAIALTVPSSYGETSTEGFSSYPLGRGKTARNFVLGFDARLVYSGAGAGCGMYFRASAAGSTSALVFEDGWALLGEFDASGEMLDSSVLDQFAAVVPGQGATNRVLVIAMEDFVLMYVNGALVADAQFAAGEGELALEMWVPADETGATAATYCQLNNVWLWEF